MALLTTPKCVWPFLLLYGLFLCWSSKTNELEEAVDPRNLFMFTFSSWQTLLLQRKTMPAQYATMWETPYIEQGIFTCGWEHCVPTPRTHQWSAHCMGDLIRLILHNVPFLSSHILQSNNHKLLQQIQNRKMFLPGQLLTWSSRQGINWVHILQKHK